MTRLLAGKILAVVLLLAIGAWLFLPRVIVDAYEDLRYAIDPTPVRAFNLGEKYFNAIDPQNYDIARAEYFFNEAAKDQSLPYVNHELARIAFLKGDFDLALSRINLQISLQGTSTPNSYYIRGLIQGFRGEYEASARDYEIYLRTDPRNWAAINDYAWVLLKDRRYKEALIAVDWGLIYWPENPWLNNSRATALFELGRVEEALDAVQVASGKVANLSNMDWLTAYPGNDPLIAPEGIMAFKTAVEENMHTISVAVENARQDVR